MNTVTREHKAGLELAMSELDIDGAAAVKLLGMIAQASAAPEQEAALTPAAYRTIDQFGSCTLSIGKIHQDSRALVLADHAERLISFGRYEIERLRAELVVMREYRNASINFSNSHGVETDTLDEAVEIERKAEERLEAAEKACWDFLSATGQPAEVKL